MTVPPNDGGPPERPTPPWGGYEYGAPPPGDDRARRRWIIGGIVVGAAVLLLGAALLIMLLAGQDDDPVAGDDPTSPTEETVPRTEPTTTAEGDEFTGKCLPQKPEVDGLVIDTSTPCDSDEAFWTITAWSGDVDATVEDGQLTDPQAAYDVCGADSGVLRPGQLWTDWYYVFDPETGAVDFLYCIEAIGNPDDEGRIPYVPTEGDCFDDSTEWWTVSCDSDLAVYEVLGVVEYEEPRELSNDEAAAEATCDGEFYWEVTTVDDRTSAVLCGDEV